MKKLLFALLLAAACATGNDAKNTAKPAEAATVSKPMPAFSLTKLGGGTFASAELAGKPLMVNFWHPS